MADFVKFQKTSGNLAKGFFNLAKELEVPCQWVKTGNAAVMEHREFLGQRLAGG